MDRTRASTQYQQRTSRCCLRSECERAARSQHQYRWHARCRIHRRDAGCQSALGAGAAAEQPRIFLSRDQVGVSTRGRRCATPNRHAEVGDGNVRRSGKAVRFVARRNVSAAVRARAGHQLRCLRRRESRLAATQRSELSRLERRTTKAVPRLLHLLSVGAAVRACRARTAAREPGQRHAVSISQRVSVLDAATAGHLPDDRAVSIRRWRQHGCHSAQVVAGAPELGERVSRRPTA